MIGELGPETVASLTKGVPNLGPRLSVVSAKGEMLAHLGTEPIGEGLGQFIAPHGITLDSRGDIYVAEVANTLLANPLWHEARSRAAFAAKTSSRELMASGTTEDSSSSTSFPHFSRQILANCLSVSCVQTINSLPPHVHKGAGG